MFLRLYCDVKRKQTQAGEEAFLTKVTQTQKPQTNRQTLLGLPAGQLTYDFAHSMQGDRCNPCSGANFPHALHPKKTENRNNTVTNSTQTLKGPTSKNPKLKNLFLEKDRYS